MVKKNGKSVQSVERAMAILHAFSLEKPEWGVGELSREMGLHKSTVSRLMSTLEQGGMLFRNAETRRYRLGIDLIGLAAHVVSYLDVRDVSRPMLRQLANDCQESVNLVVLDAPSSSLPALRRGLVVNLEQFVPPGRQIKNVGSVGRRVDVHCTAAGKVLLAYLTPDELDRILPVELEKYTPRTITDPTELRQELALVQSRGYATAQEELEEGLNVVAAPIYDYTCHVIAAASISGPASRVTPNHFAALAGMLTEVTSQISGKLGYKQVRN